MHFSYSLVSLITLLAGTHATAEDKSTKCTALDRHALQILAKDVKTGVDAGMGTRFFSAGRKYRHARPFPQVIRLTR